MITGGAGFIGSHFALLFKRDMPDSTVIALDNLKRRGSELALQRLASGGVESRHGDIRNRQDLADAGGLDPLIECLAEPSVQPGLAGGNRYLTNTNPIGTINCVDHARCHGAAMVFLSPSRVYRIAALRDLSLVATEVRFAIPEASTRPRWTTRIRSPQRRAATQAHRSVGFQYGSATLVGAILCGSGSLSPGQQQTHGPG